MASDLQQSLTRVSEKSRFLIGRFRALEIERQQLKQRVDELEQILADRDKEIDRMRTESRFMSIASTLTPDRDTLEQTRAKIAALVRDIDRCIADLNE